ncbi:MAG: hypothetical protein KJ736_12195 [Candidatus Omnitrophica bacterium]|nr:hypothetical protein [Candidatus Omnitrophota bacterium]
MGVLDYGINAPSIYQRIKDDETAYGAVVSSRTSRLIHADTNPIGRELILHAPKSGRSPVVKYVLGLQDKDITVEGLTELYKIAGIVDNDGSLAASIAIINDLDASISASEKALEAAEYQLTLAYEKIEELRKRKVENAYAEAQAINSMLQQLVEEEHKLRATNAVLRYLHLIAGGDQAKFEALRDSIKNSSNPAEELAKVFADYKRRATGSLFGVDTAEALRARQAEIAQAIADLNALSNPATNPASVVYQQDLAGLDENNNVQTIDNAIKYLEGKIAEAQANIAAQRAKLATHGVNGRYEELLMEESKLRESVTYLSEEISKTQQSIVKWEGQRSLAQGNDQWLAFTNEMITVEKQKLANFRRDLQIVKDQLWVYTVNDRYGDEIGGPISNQTVKEIINRNIVAQQVWITTYQNTIAQLRASQTVQVPDYSNLPILPETRLPGQDPKKVYTVAETLEYVETEAARIDQADAYLGRVIDRQTNHPDRILTSETVALIAQFQATLPQERTLNDLRTADALADRAIANGTSHESIEDIIARKKALLDAENALSNLREGIVDQINANINDGTYFTPEAGAEITAIINFEDKQARASLNDMVQRHGFGKNPLEGLLASMKSQIDAGKEELIVREFTNEAKKQAQEHERALAEALQSQVTTTQERNRQLMAIRDNLIKKMDEKVGAVKFNRQTRNSIETFTSRLVRAPPAVARIGNTVYLYGKEVAKIVKVNGHELVEISSADYTAIKGVDGVPTNTAQQYTVANILSNMDAYYGTIQARSEGAAAHRYILLNVSLTPEENEKLLHKFGIMYGEGTRFEMDARSALNPDADPIGETKRENVVLIMDKIAYRNGKIFAGIVGVARVNGSTDNITAAVEGVLEYSIDEKNTLILEGGFAYGQSKEITHLNISDPLTGDTVADRDVQLKAADTYNYQKITLDHRINENFSVTMAGNRVEEGEYAGLFPRQEAYFVTLGAKGNIVLNESTAKEEAAKAGRLARARAEERGVTDQKRLKEIENSASEKKYKELVQQIRFSAERAIGADRTGLTLGYKNVNVRWMDIEGTQTYGVSADIHSTETTRINVGYQLDSQKNHVFNITASKDLGNGVLAQLGANTESRMSGGLVVDIFRFAGFGDGKDNIAALTTLKSAEMWAIEFALSEAGIGASDIETIKRAIEDIRANNITLFDDIKTVKELIKKAEENGIYGLENLKSFDVVREMANIGYRSKSVDVDYTALDNQIFPRGLRSEAIRGTYEMDVTGDYEAFSTFGTPEEKVYVEFGTNGIVVPGPKAYASTTKILGAEPETKPEDEDAAAAIFLDGRVQRGITEIQLSYAIPVKYLTAKQRQDAGIGYTKTLGYFFYREYKGDMRSIDLGLTGDAMIITRSDSRKAGIPSAYPIIVKLSNPQMTKTDKWLASYGYIVRKGQAFTEFTEGMLNGTEVVPEHDTIIFGLKSEELIKTRYSVPVAGGSIFKTEAEIVDMIIDGTYGMGYWIAKEQGTEYKNTSILSVEAKEGETGAFLGLDENGKEGWRKPVGMPETSKLKSNDFDAAEFDQNADETRNAVEEIKVKETESKNRDLDIQKQKSESEKRESGFERELRELEQQLKKKLQEKCDEVGAVLRDRTTGEPILLAANGSIEELAAMGLFANTTFAAAPAATVNIEDLNKYTLVRGVTFSVVANGQDRQAGFDWDAAIKHIPAMKAVGITTIRTYVPVTSVKFLDALEANGMKVIVGIPYNDDRFVANKYDIKSGSYRAYINKFKGHKAILMWEFGNEYNYHPEWFGGDINKWYTALEVAAKWTQANDTTRQVATAHGEVPTADVLRKVPSVDVWGVNVYRNAHPEAVLREFKALLAANDIRDDLKLYISETGTDAFNNNTNREDQDMQAEAIATLWNNIYAEAKKPAYKDMFMGVTFMTWQDELFKAGNPNAHDTKGSALSILGDGISNEEWYGIGNRKASDVLKTAWAIEVAANNNLTKQEIEEKIAALKRKIEAEKKIQEELNRRQADEKKIQEELKQRQAAVQQSAALPANKIVAKINRLDTVNKKLATYLTVAQLRGYIARTPEALSAPTGHIELEHRKDLRSGKYIYFRDANLNGIPEGDELETLSYRDQPNAAKSGELYQPLKTPVIVYPGQPKSYVVDFAGKTDAAKWAIFKSLTAPYYAVPTANGTLYVTSEELTNPTEEFNRFLELSDLDWAKDPSKGRNSMPILSIKADGISGVTTFTDVTGKQRVALKLPDSHIASEADVASKYLVIYQGKAKRFDVPTYKALSDITSDEYENISEVLKIKKVNGVYQIIERVALDVETLSLDESEVEVLEDIAVGVHGTMAKPVLLGIVYDLNADGSRGAVKAMTQELGKIAFRDGMTESEADRNVEVRIIERRDFATHALVSAVGINEVKGYMQIELYAAPETLTNGKRIEGKAFYGERQLSRRPVYYYNSEYKLVDAQGEIINELTEDNAVGFAVRRPELDMVGSGIIAALKAKGRRIVVTEEQGLEKIVTTLEQARSVLGVEQHHRTNSEFIEVSLEEGIDRARVDVIDAMLVKDFAKDRASIIAQDSIESMMTQIRKLRLVPVGVLKAYEEKDSNVWAQIDAIMAAKNLQSTKEVIRYLAGQVDYLSIMLNRLEDREFLKGFIIDAKSNVVKATITRATESSNENRKYFYVEFRLAKEGKVDPDNNAVETYVATRGVNATPYIIITLKDSSRNTRAIDTASELRQYLMAQDNGTVLTDHVEEAINLGLANIANELKMGGMTAEEAKERIDNLKFILSETIRANGVIDYVVRIKQDSQARKFVVISSEKRFSPDITIGIDFEGASARKAIEFSGLNKIFKVTSITRLTPAQLENKLGMPEDAKLSAEMPQGNIGYESQKQLVEIRRGIWTGNSSESILMIVNLLIWVLSDI